MSMISPATYKRFHENDTLEKLQKERDELIQSMKAYENHEIPEERYNICPSPGVVYSCDVDYLKELIELIKEKVSGKGMR